MAGKQLNYSNNRKRTKKVKKIPVNRKKYNARYHAKSQPKKYARKRSLRTMYDERPIQRISPKMFMRLGVAAAIVICLLAIFLYIQNTYTVTNIYVEGNVHYTNEEIQNMIMEGPLGDNSLYLSLKYKNKEITDIPFIETMSVKIVSPDTIRINVYEKALAGYVEYLGRYMYFDREGIIVESSEKKTQKIPQVTGLEFSFVVLHEKLPVENEEIFNQILDITQLLTKYGITSDRIYFDKDYEMTLYFDDAKVMIGGSDHIDEKIMQLQYLLPELEGKSGTLHMENYTEDTKNITFNLDSE